MRFGSVVWWCGGGGGGGGVVGVLPPAPVLPAKVFFATSLCYQYQRLFIYLFCLLNLWTPEFHESIGTSSPTSAGMCLSSSLEANYRLSYDHGHVMKSLP